MTHYQDKYHESGLAAQVDSIRNTVKRFDEATLSAAYSIRDAEMHLGEATLTQADADAIWDPACAVAPHAPGIITMLSNLDHLPVEMQTALPELVNDTNIARITDALRFIDNELNNYFAGFRCRPPRQCARHRASAPSPGTAPQLRLLAGV